MINLKNYDIKYIASTVFGFLALVISLIAGLFSGNGMSVILFRTVLTVIIFSVIGLLCVVILKKYVPEIYQVLASSNSPELEIRDEDGLADSEGKAVPDGITGEDGQQSGMDGAQETYRDDKDLESEFNTIDKRENGSAGFSEEISGSSSLKDKKVVYEPKIAAQAIRTMLKKDE